jgi:DNA replicative helicase MCM subunit Mcm2 (Cdc46/Mcm family)
MVCSNTKCGITVTAVTIIVAVEPAYGQGAYSIATKIAATGTIPQPLMHRVDLIPLAAQKSRMPK